MNKTIFLLLLFCVTPLYPLTRQDVKNYVHRNKKTIIITSLVLGVTTYFIWKYSAKYGRFMVTPTHRLKFRKKRAPFINKTIDPSLLQHEVSDEDGNYDSDIFPSEAGD